MENAREEIIARAHDLAAFQRATEDEQEKFDLGEAFLVDLMNDFTADEIDSHIGEAFVQNLCVFDAETETFEQFYNLYWLPIVERELKNDYDA